MPIGSLHYYYYYYYTHRFMSLLDFVRHYPCEPAPERSNQSGFTGTRDSEWQWHQLGNMQICTLTQTPNHASIPPLSFFTGWMPFLLPNKLRQSTEGNIIIIIIFRLPQPLDGCQVAQLVKHLVG